MRKCIEFRATIWSHGAKKDIMDDTLTSMENLYKLLPGGVFRCHDDEGLTLSFANDETFRFLRLTREIMRDCYGNRMMEFVVDEDRERLKHSITNQTSPAGIIGNSHRVKLHDGTIRWISMNASREVDSEGNSFLYIVFLDVTDQKEIEERLLRTQIMYEMAADFSDINVWEYNLETRTCIHDARALALYGLPHEWHHMPEPALNSNYVTETSKEDFRRLY